MRRMRQTVSEHNIYRWAAHLLEDLANMRVAEADGKDARGANTRARAVEVA